MKKAILEHVQDRGNSSFSVEYTALPYFPSLWHYHPVNEIILFLESTGTGFIGDTICQFHAGTVGIIGREMPHVWLNGKEYYEGNPELVARVIVIWFKDNFLGEIFNNIPEMMDVKQFLILASRGMVFHGRTQKILEEKIKVIRNMDPLQRVICLLDILNIMARSDEYKLLASSGYPAKFNELSIDRVSRVCEYIMHNFTKDLSLAEVAGVANMSTNSFCRFFKQSFLKTFKYFLLEIRIGNACKLLLEREVPVALAAYNSGFNNLTHFHRQFKKYTGITPGEYSKRYSKRQLNST